jgi:hypothetical protein
MLLFDVKANPYPVKPKAQSPLEEACDDGIMLTIISYSSHLRIYTANAQTGFNRVYSANDTHIWESFQTVHGERNNIFFEIG